MSALVLGSLVGNLLAKVGFPGVNNFNKDGKQQVLTRDTAQMTNANVIGDQFQLAVLPSNTLVDPISSWCWFDAFGGTTTLNIGDVNFPTGLASALAVGAAGNAAIWKGFSAAKMSLPLWQALGYGSDPGGNITLLATVATANVANTANFAWQLMGKRG